MKQYIVPAALALSSVFAPLAAHASAFGPREEMRRPAVVRHEAARPVYTAPVAVRHVEYGRHEAFRAQSTRGHVFNRFGRW